MPPRKPMNDEPCPVARGVDLIGDRWSLLIVRDAFDGMRRFGDFQRSLGMARNILADRLRKLVEAGVLEMQGASDGSAYQEYVLTDRGRACFPWWWRYGNGENGTCSRRVNGIRCSLISVAANRCLLWPRQRRTAACWRQARPRCAR